MILKFKFVEPETVKTMVNWSWYKKNRSSQIEDDIKEQTCMSEYTGHHRLGLTNLNLYYLKIVVE